MREGSQLALALRLAQGTLTLGEAFSFMSGLYFRGKLGYAQAFGRHQTPALVITPTRGLLPPDDFVPLAEACGLIRPIGEWTFERALSQAGAWQRAHPGRCWVAVNVSAPQLAQHEAYIQRIQSCLEANGVPAASLELELTFRALATRPD